MSGPTTSQEEEVSPGWGRRTFTLLGLPFKHAWWWLIEDVWEKRIQRTLTGLHWEWQKMFYWNAAGLIQKFKSKQYALTVAFKHFPATVLLNSWMIREAYVYPEEAYALAIVARKRYSKDLNWRYLSSTDPRISGWNELLQHSCVTDPNLDPTGYVEEALDFLGIRNGGIRGSERKDPSLVITVDELLKPAVKALKADWGHDDVPDSMIRAVLLPRFILEAYDNREHLAWAVGNWYAPSWDNAAHQAYQTRDAIDLKIITDH